MLTGLNMSSLACKCVLYRPEHDSKGMGTPWYLIFKALKYKNEPVDKAQRVDEKTRVICLVIFTPRIMVNKMSKMAHFLYFLLMTSKKFVIVCAKY